jgi:S-adenosylmethionine:tRNA ribosyltransferase-isomerase
MRSRSVAFATLTHAAGLSSTGDAELDRRLPFDEPYRILPATAIAIRRVRARGGRVVAVGTTVVRALEHAASRDGRVWAGDGLATQRIGAATHLQVVDAILTGTHEPGTSHYELLRAFTDDATLGRVNNELGARGYRTHEFGDSVLIERNAGVMTSRAGALRRETAPTGHPVESSIQPLYSRVPDRRVPMDRGLMPFPAMRLLDRRRSPHQDGLRRRHLRALGAELPSRVPV